MTFITDMMGLYPLYSIRTNSFFAFASEFQILVSLVDDLYCLDKQFFSELALYGFTCEGRTPLTRVCALPGATIRNISRTGEVVSSLYYNWDYQLDFKSSFEDHGRRPGLVEASGHGQAIVLVIEPFLGGGVADAEHGHAGCGQRPLGAGYPARCRLRYRTGLADAAGRPVAALHNGLGGTAGGQSRMT